MVVLVGPPAFCPHSGSEVRVLLFNATGDRDTAALLKLLLVRFRSRTGDPCTRTPGFSACAETGFAVGVGSCKVLSVCPSVPPAVPGCTPTLTKVWWPWVQGGLGLPPDQTPVTPVGVLWEGPKGPHGADPLLHAALLL